MNNEHETKIQGEEIAVHTVSVFKYNSKFNQFLLMNNHLKIVWPKKTSSPADSAEASFSRQGMPRAPHLGLHRRMCSGAATHVLTALTAAHKNEVYTSSLGLKTPRYCAI